MLRAALGAERDGCRTAARVALYLCVAGLGLLGRVVHCNVGRPEAWVFVPGDYRGQPAAYGLSALQLYGLAAIAATAVAW